MLRCIPALHDVPQIQNEEDREDLAAAAVILRQFEEMDQDQDSSEDKNTARWTAAGDAVFSAAVNTRESSQSSDHGVNFLDITKAILRTTTTSGSNGLADAVGWLALRQEIYYAFQLGRSPQISLPREQEREASPVNRVILHTYQVAKWNYGEKTAQEWGKCTQLSGNMIISAETGEFRQTEGPGRCTADRMLQSFHSSPESRGRQIKG